MKARQTMNTNKRKKRHSPPSEIEVFPGCSVEGVTLVSTRVKRLLHPAIRLIREAATSTPHQALGRLVQNSRLLDAAEPLRSKVYPSPLSIIHTAASRAEMIKFYTSDRRRLKFGKLVVRKIIFG